MGTITAQLLDLTISRGLSDVDHDIWDREKDIFNAINQALRAIIMLRPDAYKITENMLLSQNDLIQNLPDGAIILDNITRNRGTSGTDNGKEIIRVDKLTMNDCLPGWMSETTDSRIRNYIFEDDKPREFIAYPIPTEALYVEICYGKEPVKLTTPGDTICIPDTYETPITEFAMFRCQSMEIDGANINIAMQHLTNFFNLMGTKASNEITRLRLKGLV